MKLRKSIAILPLISDLGLAFGQDDRQLDPSAQERHELEVQKHRSQVLHAILTISNPQTPFDFLNFGIQGPTVSAEKRARTCEKSTSLDLALIENHTHRGTSWSARPSMPVGSRTAGRQQERTRLC